MSERTLEGRVIVVTGVSRGIGAGIAASLLDAGARVLGVSRTRGNHEGVVELQQDLLAPDAPAVVLDAALAAFGRVDGLVNNAGLLIAGPCWEQPDAELDAMLALNLTVPFLISQVFAAHWLVRGERGTILNVCSIESEVAWADPPQAAYAASKGGLLGLTRALALELAPHGIRVVAVGPGPVATAMTPETQEVGAAIPLGGAPASPREIGDVAAFLLSDAARHITGQILYADGGYLLA